MRLRTRTFLWLAAVLSAAGCTGDSGSTGPLPMHMLDFGRQPPAARNVGRGACPYGSTAGGSIGLPSAVGYRDWRYIVIHHSATPNGNAETIDRAHRARGWDSLGYHFVIDNGDGGPDGRVEVGPRWTSQKWGAHTGHTPNNEYNNYGIGICLVGDFTSRLPSQAQLASLRDLVGKLSAQFGIEPENVIGHRDAPGASTECPGDALHYWVHHTLQPVLARQYAKK